MSLKDSKLRLRAFLSSAGFVAFFTVLPLVNVLAWGDEGHRITVRIAARHLDSQARAEVGRLILADVRNNGFYYQQSCPNVFAISKKPANEWTDADKNTFVYDGLACIASWADPPVKNQRNYTSNWHFVDIPVVRATSQSPLRYSYDAARDCPTDEKRGDCAVQALRRLEFVLGNPKKQGHVYGEELTTRADAFKFFIHIVGDIHQPLHCVTHKKNEQAVADLTDTGDLGGNFTLVSWFGDTDTPYGFMNLHSVWDSSIIERAIQSETQKETGYTNRLISNSQSLNLAQIQAGDTSDWIAKSYDLAVTNAYGKLPVFDGACQMKFENQTKTGCHKLSENYYSVNKSKIEEQLIYGGVRLAKKLNSLF